MQPVIIDYEKCKKRLPCGICVNICPEDVFVMTDNGPQVAYPDECYYCGACAMDCPASAIKVRIPLAMKVSALRGKRP
jgi:NAD-dependent dihydropyrimidine dehydrogenase PreA subunit